MHNNKFSNLIQITGVLLLTALLNACGGGGGGGSNNPNPSPTPDPDPDPVPEVMPITQSTTTMGGTYSADSLVSVLVYNAEAEGFEAATEDRTGMTLYTFDMDPVGSSACTSQTCVEAWPPLLADETATAELPLTMIERDDGNLQWALRGKPLYFFVNDTAPGDVTGEGVNGVWHVALKEPVLLNDSALNSADGDYWVASGEVLVTAPETEGQTDVFVAQTQNMEGFTLYTFAMDAPGVFNCSGGCLANWPALLAHDGETAEPPFSIVERTLGDGGAAARQWAYHGKPLYFFVGDTTAGITSGKNIPNWHLARPLPWQVVDSARGSILAASGLVLSAAPNAEDVEETQSVPMHGFTLYTFDNDTPATSDCTGSCLTNWPALMAHAGAEASGPFSLITRPSGAMQWALNGDPLYFYIGDIAAGDIAGDEVNDVWHIARVPPVVVDTHPEQDQIFVAWGNLVDETGAPDSQYAGFTLYTFAEDTAGVSTCFGNCADIWPPLYAPMDAKNFGDFTVTMRDDPATTADDNLGIKQWAYQNQPLYFYAGDTQPGDVTGEYGTWFFARP